MSKDRRKEILDKLNKNPGVKEHSPPGFSFFKKSKSPHIQNFAKKLEIVNGVFYHCQSKVDLVNKLKEELNKLRVNKIYCEEGNIKQVIGSLPGVSDSLKPDTDVAITGCEVLVAESGSVIVSSEQAMGRQAFVLPQTHIVIAFKDQIAETLTEGIELALSRYPKNAPPSQLTTITGASRTADIEKTLVLGAHGPNMLIIFYLDE